MGRLYVSGPMFEDEDGNRLAFERAKEDLHRAGYEEVAIPHNVAVGSRTVQEAMRERVREITYKTTDGVALMDGWESDLGSYVESMVASVCGVPYKTVGDWIEEAAR